jgi:hypothetical protein
MHLPDLDVHVLHRDEWRQFLLIAEVVGVERVSDETRARVSGDWA